MIGNNGRRKPPLFLRAPVSGKRCHECQKKHGTLIAQDLTLADGRRLRAYFHPAPADCFARTKARQNRLRLIRAAKQKEKVA